MFASLKRWIRAGRDNVDQGDVLAEWARSEGHAFKRVKDKTGGGYVVEAADGWRVEWGGSQRPYVIGKELRFRCDTGLPGDVQMVMLTRVLAQTLESDVFSRFTNAMQTQIDHTLPDEMRWLAMHPKVNLQHSPVLGKRFVLLCNAEPMARSWLELGLLPALEEAASHWWTDGLVFVVTLNRGMLTARMAGQPLQQTQLRLVGQMFAKMATAARTLAKTVEAA
jgi:hypothetical protein